MTREEIELHKPGRELNAAVAFNVMGWYQRGDMYVEMPSGEEVRPVESWHPSTDIGAAWEVVEKLGKEVTVKRYEGMAGFMYWCRTVGTDPNVFDETVAHGPTAPEAICKAALLTLIEEERP